MSNSILMLEILTRSIKSSDYNPFEQQTQMKYSLKNSKRLVIKIGSALLVEDESGRIHRTWLTSLIDDIVACHQAGQEIVLVSSGAVALGRRLLKFTHSKILLEQKQAAAAVGQIQLAHAYQEMLAKHGIPVAQILLGLADSEDRKRYLNARNTLQTLLKAGVIPVINENDVVATSEIRYGDNDRLAARVAQMISADTLVLLSDIDGLYTADPRLDANAQFIAEVTSIDKNIRAMAGQSSTDYGSGGMETKIAAAEIVMGSGCHMLIAKGAVLNPIQQIVDGGKFTWFHANTTPARARKHWIQQHLQPKGQLIIDAGAAKALHNGKSLLAAGVMAISGDFQKGDAVIIADEQQQEIARGLCNYPSLEAQRIIGRQSSEIAAILGYEGTAAMIHRDDLALVKFP